MARTNLLPPLPDFYSDPISAIPRRGRIFFEVQHNGTFTRSQFIIKALFFCERSKTAKAAFIRRGKGRPGMSVVNNAITTLQFPFIEGIAILGSRVEPNGITDRVIPSSFCRKKSNITIIFYGNWYSLLLCSLRVTKRTKNKQNAQCNICSNHRCSPNKTFFTGVYPYK